MRHVVIERAGKVRRHLQSIRISVLATKFGQVAANLDGKPLKIEMGRFNIAMFFLCCSPHRSRYAANLN